MTGPKPWISRVAALALVAVPLGLLATRGALAQATLDELEQQIRKEMAENQGKPAPQPAAQGAREPGYVGMVTDDRNDRGRGVRILKVRPGSPAERAGLEPCDLIVGMAGMRLRQMSDMAVILQQVRPGGSVAVEVLRGDQKMRMEVTATQRPAPEPEPPAAVPPATIPAPPVALPAVAPVPKAAVPVDDRARIEQLQRRVEALERRMAELESLLRKSAKQP